jgi:hypothetical protein
MDNQLYTFYGAGHVPYLGSGATAQAYMDTTVNFYRDFLVRQLGCSQTAIQPANPMAQEGVMYSLTYCDGSPVNEVCATASLNEVVLPDFVLYPNPATNNVRIDVTNEASFSVIIVDLSGRIVFTNDFNESIATVDVAGLTPGNYFVHVKGNTHGTIQSKKLIVQ